MDYRTSDRPLPVGQESSSQTQTKPANANLRTKVINWFEKYLLVLVIGGFIAGIAVASVSKPVIDQVDTTINLFMDVYSYIAPVAIFLILTPSLASMFATRKTGKFGLLVINWFALRKVLASLWAILFIVAVFRIPFLPQGSVSLADGLGQTLDSLGNMMLTSTYFWAMYAAIAVSVISIKVERLTQSLEKIMDAVEVMGSYLLPLLPIFMFGIGAYIYGLPDNVQEQVGLDAQGKSVLLDLNIWGWVTSPQTPAGMISIYVIGALLTAIACLIWQSVFLVLARAIEPRFSITGYFKNYWVKVYPLLWATSSEALATPLQLYLTKKHAPWIPLYTAFRYRSRQLYGHQRDYNKCVHPGSDCAADLGTERVGSGAPALDTRCFPDQLWGAGNPWGASAVCRAHGHHVEYSGTNRAVFPSRVFRDTVGSS